MGFGWQSGQRSRRSPRGRLGRFLEFRVDAAEAVLAAVAVVLVVWLLWPEERGPSLVNDADDQRVVDRADSAPAELQPAPTAGKAPEGSSDLATAARGDSTTADLRSERQRIATPSELADRLQARAIDPAPQRPQRSVDAVPAARTASAENPNADEAASQQTSKGLVPPEAVEVALSGMINRLTDGQDEIDNPPAQTSNAALEEQEPPVLSSERLETDSLADIDLSDLDTLVPVPDETEIAAVDPAVSIPVDPAPSDESDTEPFVIDRDPSVPDNDVRARPRDDAPTWLRNAVASPFADDRPIIAIVLDDLGLNRRNTAAVNDLPAPLTLAFLPYAGRIEAQTQAAHDAGHELMLHLPMEPLGSDWPGPDALTTKINQTEFIERLLKNLDRFEGFVGINNHMGSKLTADSSRMEVVMQELRKRDVLFLDSKTSARSVAGDVAGEHGVPNTTRDIFLDNVIDVEAIKRQLSRAEQVARSRGSAVAIGHPHDATIEALRQWLPNMEARGFVLAPISAVVARRACRNGVLIADETCGQYLQVQKATQPALFPTDS